MYVHILSFTREGEVLEVVPRRFWSSSLINGLTPGASEGPVDGGRNFEACKLESTTLAGGIA
jgi:hypothetical protein